MPGVTERDWVVTYERESKGLELKREQIPFRGPWAWAAELFQKIREKAVNHSVTLHEI